MKRFRFLRTGCIKGDRKQVISFAYDHHRVHAVYYREFKQKLHRKMHKNRPQLLEGSSLFLHDNVQEYCNRKAERLRMGTVTSCCLHSAHESTRLDLFLNLCADVVSLLWWSFLARYQNHSQMNRSAMDGIVKLPKR